MAHLDLGPARKEYAPKTLFLFFERIKTALNYLDKTNFPNKINGDDILKDLSTSLKKLKQRIYIYTLFTGSPLYQTTSTTAVGVAGYFPWNPADFDAGGAWYFEADIAIVDAASIATCELHGASGIIKSVTTQSTALVRVRSTEVTMPATATDMWIKLKTSNASHTASLGGAKLIFKPS